eukprot:7546266-Alexandrium_andersonii.AAC.1
MSSGRRIFLRTGGTPTPPSGSNRSRRWPRGERFAGRAGRSRRIGRWPERCREGWDAAGRPRARG